MKNITLIIDGKNISCPPGTSLLVAAEEHGIKIPRLCHHHSLKPFGACRICLVEDEKSGRLMASCVTPATQDMIILTDTPRIKKHRINIIRLMMAEHPESCVVCNKGNRCKLRQIAAGLGIGEINLYPMPNYKTFEQTNPFIVRDLSKCILCGKCIRADHELVVTGAIDYNLRGFKSRPTTVYNLPLEQSNCTFCGTCISICPTGALSTKTSYVGTPQQETISVCGFCGVGCSLKMGTVNEHVVEVNPSHNPKTVNDATLCVRGHFAHDFLNSSNRLTQPLIRENGSRKNDPLISAPWDDTLEMVKNMLISTKEESGPQSIAFLGSSKCTNEENYLFQKIARVILGTNNIDNGGYMYGRHIFGLLGSRKRSDSVNLFAGPLSRLEEAEVIFVLGADPGQCAPVVNYYLKRGSKKEIPMIVAGQRHKELVNFSSVLLTLSPDSETGQRDLSGVYIQLIYGITALIIENKGYDLSFVDRFTQGFDLFKKDLLALDLNKISRVTGVDRETLNKTAELLKGKRISFVLGDGISRLKYGKQLMNALINLSLVTGSVQAVGAGFHVIANENNQVGAWLMGSVPDGLPLSYFLTEDSAKSQWEEVWQADISSDQGLNMVQMIEAAEKGTLKALYIMGENPIRSLPQSDRVRKAFEKIEYIIVQDIIANETTQVADVVLPGAAFSEKSGSFTNMEGRLQMFSPAAQPPGQAKTDLEILGLIAERMKPGEKYGSIEKIRAEINRIIPLYSWTNTNQDSVFLKDTGQNQNSGSDEKNELIPFSPVFSTRDEPSDTDYPFTAILGHMHYHLGSGTRTCHSATISAMVCKGEVEISPKDSSQIELKDGDMVSVTSPFGSIQRAVRIEKMLSPGLVFVPLAVSSNDARDLVQLNELFKSDSDSWDTCRVKVEKIKE